jgi:23S rRNA (uridine2552-2'-O)-methyltransferase
MKLIKKGMAVLDVGAAPGSWSLYVLRSLQQTGRLVAVDLKPFKLKGNHPNLFTMAADIFSQEAGDFLKQKGPYQLIISDAAPNTSGNRLVDTRKSFDLVEMVLNLAETQLAPGGAVLCKIFQGGDEEELFDRMKNSFKSVRRVKPKAVRPESFESYFIAMGYLKAQALDSADE